MIDDSETSRRGDGLQACAHEARDWLFEAALPVWLQHGLNPAGGFLDRLDDTYRPVGQLMRMRVQARQTYVFAEAGRLGWTGDWRRAVEHGADFLLNRARREDGLAARTFDMDGTPKDEGPDFYDQAFALFSYAQAYDVLGDNDLRAAARKLIEVLQRGYAHPLGGIREPLPGKAPLQANPHMHLLEACQAWAPLDHEGPWSGLADQLASLCLEHMIEPKTAALREFFSDNWGAAPGPAGDITEPGHHFEWAWLLLRQGRGADQALRLAERAEALGVDPRRGVAIDEIAVDGRVLADTARLWPQTERIKAALSLRETDWEVWSERAVQAHHGLFAFIRPAARGLWFDRMQPDGRVAPEPATASSFYHIICALSQLIRAA
jgi:mannose-6-phosphate isomerase